MRTEKDKIGEIKIPYDSLYGINTKRALDNFALRAYPVRMDIVYAIVLVKKAAAMTHKELGLMDGRKADALISACSRILAGGFEHAFPTSSLQGGAGTSTNMNVNEVIANLAIEELGGKYGEYDIVNPLDDVNKGQSTNDVYPTALRIAAVKKVRELSLECSILQESLQKKEHEYADVMKLGRTELMDALPMSIGQEFGAYAQAIARDRWRIYKSEERLRQVNIGGTAIGTGDNASRRYAYRIIEILRDITDMGLARAEYPIDLTQNADVFAEVSGFLRALAVNLMKISGDLKLMNSTPFGEIHLKELQAGSTIMPGKVNPVIPEMMVQISIKVYALDSAVAMAAGMGQLELNACIPLIADCFLEELDLLISGVKIFRERCIDVLTVDKENCQRHLKNSAAAVTTLSRYIGYDKAAEISKITNNDEDAIRKYLHDNHILEDELIDRILNHRDFL